MRIGDIRSLFWLYRWYNGRSDRLDEIHDEHLSTLSQLIRNEIGGDLLQGEQSVSLCDFDVRFLFNPSTGLEIISIEPPDLLDGLQLDLFEEEEGYAEMTA